jgi:DNA-binding transcriptional LysR family regulator
VIVAKAPERLYLDRIYETDMAEALKAMAIAGHGVAFLPHSAVEDAVAAGALVRLDRPARGVAADRFTLTMEIRLYRDKLAVAGEDPRHALVRQLWEVVANELRGGPVEAPRID